MDEPTRPCCFSRYVRIVARTTFAVVNNLYCIPAYVVWMMALRLVRPLYAPLYWKIEGLMYHWLLAMVSMWSWTAGYESEVCRKRWKCIRDSYKRIKRKNKLPTDSATGAKSKWHLLESLSFMNTVPTENKNTVKTPNDTNDSLKEISNDDNSYEETSCSTRCSGENSETTSGAAIVKVETSAKEELCYKETADDSETQNENARPSTGRVMKKKKQNQSSSMQTALMTYWKDRDIKEGNSETTSGAAIVKVETSDIEELCYGETADDSETQNENARPSTGRVMTKEKQNQSSSMQTALMTYWEERDIKQENSETKSGAAIVKVETSDIEELCYEETADDSETQNENARPSTGRVITKEKQNQSSSMQTALMTYWEDRDIKQENSETTSGAAIVKVETSDIEELCYEETADDSETQNENARPSTGKVMTKEKQNQNSSMQTALMTYWKDRDIKEENSETTSGAAIVKVETSDIEELSYEESADNNEKQNKNARPSTGGVMKKKKQNQSSSMQTALTTYWKDRDTEKQTQVQVLPFQPISIQELEPDVDGIKSFCSHVGAMLRKITPALRVQAKTKVFNILAEHELMSLDQSLAGCDSTDSAPDFQYLSSNT